MSVLLEFSVFPVGEGSSLSRYVTEVLRVVDRAGHAYQLTAMGTIVETASLAEALSLLERACASLDELGCERVYLSSKLDIRKGGLGRLQAKVDSVRARLEGEPPDDGATQPAS
jgi:uncharacterized protein (TIGR00106 family)